MNRIVRKSGYLFDNSLLIIGNFLRRLRMRILQKDCQSVGLSSENPCLLFQRWNQGQQPEKEF